MENMHKTYRTNLKGTLPYTYFNKEGMGKTTIPKKMQKQTFEDEKNKNVF